MQENKTPQDIAAMPFEEALAELEKTVAKMENGGQTLDQLMEEFEKGKALTAHCRSKLEGLEKKILLLTRDNGAEGEWSDLDAGSSRSESVPF